jgi:hypothetical protein
MFTEGGYPSQPNRSVRHRWLALAAEGSLRVTEAGLRIPNAHPGWKFINLPELLSMFRSVADVQTTNMLNLPRPAICDGYKAPDGF